jgi:tRNA A37 threonylcarbamoyladenosine dehydratase
MGMEEAIFRRSELLLGNEAMERIAQKRVIVFGVGGVGSWCAESLVRSGIRQLTIVDFDSVDVTNVNRQLMATTKTVGQVKVEALILLATSLPSAGEDRSAPKFYSSMGAALKLDPTRIQITEFWKVKGDPLARALRNRFKKEKLFPKRKFQCVYSDELVQAKDEGKGSLVHITAIFGFMLAGLVIQDATKL